MDFEDTIAAGRLSAKARAAAKKQADKEKAKWTKLAEGARPLTDFFSMLPKSPPRTHPLNRQTPSVEIIEDEPAAATLPEVITPPSSPIIELNSPSFINKITVSSQHSSDEEEEFIQPNFSRSIESSSESDEEEEPPLKRFCRDAFFEEGAPVNLPNPLASPDTQTWIKRVMKTLRDYSVSSELEEEVAHPFKSLTKQWVATGRYIDTGRACATCELCTKERIRYLFTIRNKRNNNELDVGSKCIEHFSTLGLAFQPTTQAEPCSIEESSQKISEMVTKTQHEGQQYTNMMQRYCRRS